MFKQCLTRAMLLNCSESDRYWAVRNFALRYSETKLLSCRWRFFPKHLLGCVDHRESQLLETEIAPMSMRVIDRSLGAPPSRELNQPDMAKSRQICFKNVSRLSRHHVMVCPPRRRIGRGKIATGGIWKMTSRPPWVGGALSGRVQLLKLPDECLVGVCATVTFSKKRVII
jgi:hypothetical protein